MPRKLPDIIAHIRAVAGDPSISTTLIQTEDLLALCTAAEHHMNRELMPMCEFIELQTGQRPNDATRGPRPASWPKLDANYEPFAGKFDGE